MELYTPTCPKCDENCSLIEHNPFLSHDEDLFCCEMCDIVMSRDERYCADRCDCGKRKYYLENCCYSCSSERVK